MDVISRCFQRVVESITAKFAPFKVACCRHQRPPCVSVLRELPCREVWRAKLLGESRLSDACGSPEHGETDPVTGALARFQGQKRRPTSFGRPSAQRVTSASLPDVKWPNICKFAGKPTLMVLIGMMVYGRGTASMSFFVSRREAHYSVVYRTANASLLNGVHGEARMTFLWVCPSCRLGAKPTGRTQRGGEGWLHGGRLAG